VGDYYYSGDALKVRISDLGNADYEFLVLIHELVESYLCAKRGISEPRIAAFDQDHPELRDPGADPRSPYRKEHLFSETIEHLIAKELGINWDEYDEVVNSLLEQELSPEQVKGTSSDDSDADSVTS